MELLQKAGPYVLVELLLPGGTLFALLLFLYQRRQPIDGLLVLPGLAWAVSSARDCERDGLEPLAMAPSRCGRPARASSVA
jgi:hypothetical protein